MAYIGLFSFYGGFSQAWAILNDVNIGIIRYYGRIELRDLLECCRQSVSRVRRDTSSNDPYRQASPESDTFFILRISFIWNGEWRNEFPGDHRRLKADTHEVFCSRGTLRKQISSVCTNDFMGTLHPWEQNFHPAKCSTIFNRLNIWEQAPGANWANLKTLPRVYWHVQNEPGACYGRKTPCVYRP